jgi:fumarylpyruvate hydrolase
MAYVVAEPPRATVTVAGSNELLPVHRIYCVGRNYAALAREMGGDPAREPPFFFMQLADAVVASGAVLDFPLATQDLHHEIELVAAIGKGVGRLEVRYS